MTLQFAAQMHPEEPSDCSHYPQHQTKPSQSFPYPHYETDKQLWVWRRSTLTLFEKFHLRWISAAKNNKFIHYIKLNECQCSTIPIIAKSFIAECLFCLCWYSLCFIWCKWLRLLTSSASQIRFTILGRFKLNIYIPSVLKLSNLKKRLNDNWY